MNTPQNPPPSQLFIHNADGTRSYQASPDYSHFQQLAHILSATSPKATLLGREDFSLTAAETLAFAHHLHRQFLTLWNLPREDRSPRPSHASIHFEGTTRKLWLQYPDDEALHWLHRFQAWMQETEESIHFSNRIHLSTDANRILIALWSAEAPCTRDQILDLHLQRFGSPPGADPSTLLRHLIDCGLLLQDGNTCVPTPKGRLPH
jgi:hypothetical protein